MTPPKVSIIMRCKNSDWVIAQALAALYSQTFKDFELLIVDSGSTDTTLEIIKHYPHTLIQIEPKDYFPGAVLNMAISKARGEIIVFQNSDAVPLLPQTLEKLVDAFKEKSIEAAFCRQLPRPEAETWVKIDYAKSFPDQNNAAPWISLSLPMAAMRKSIWQKHKFYTDAWASEDTEWGQWALDTGHKIKYLKDALVMHSHNYTLKQLYGRKFVEGEADAFIYKTKPQFFKFLQKALSSAIREVIEHFPDFDISGLLKTPSRCFVREWAYFKGLQLGTQRRLNKDPDNSQGQVVILNSYDDGRQK